MTSFLAGSTPARSALRCFRFSVSVYSSVRDGEFPSPVDFFLPERHRGPDLSRPGVAQEHPQLPPPPPRAGDGGPPREPALLHERRGGRGGRRRRRLPGRRGGVPPGRLDPLGDGGRHDRAGHVGRRPSSASLELAVGLARAAALAGLGPVGTGGEHLRRRGCYVDVEAVLGRDVPVRVRQELARGPGPARLVVLGVQARPEVDLVPSPPRRRRRHGTPPGHDDAAPRADAAPQRRGDPARVLPALSFPPPVAGGPLGRRALGLGRGRSRRRRSHEGDGPEGPRAGHGRLGRGRRRLGRGRRRREPGTTGLVDRRAGGAVRPRPAQDALEDSLLPPLRGRRPGRLLRLRRPVAPPVPAHGAPVPALPGRRGRRVDGHLRGRGLVEVLHEAPVLVLVAPRHLLGAPGRRRARVGVAGGMTPEGGVMGARPFVVLVAGEGGSRVCRAARGTEELRGRARRRGHGPRRRTPVARQGRPAQDRGEVVH
mmetsp:Transcript_19586/g.44840  ORF Transcript_19586/g.44840 Transcript_19586/m.44840 type:complete len:484 (-) Transcript_19586:595-2046(-)